MSVTRGSSHHQPAVAGGTPAPIFMALALALSLPAPALRAETHANFQGVTSVGTSAWPVNHPVVLQGVLLTDVDEMLDSAPNFQPSSVGTMGGEWQIAFQAVAPDDRGGTICWMGQNYAIRRPPSFSDEFSYANEEWTNEIHRLNHDPATGHVFRKGDLIEVTANRSLFFGGKRNVNEAHDKDPTADFTISLVASNYGLPRPEVISLMSVMDQDDGDPDTSEDIFDATRQSGGEYYQGMRVRINGLTLVTTNGWNPTNVWRQRRVTVADGDNRFVFLRHPRYDLGPPPDCRFDAIGVFNQESDSGAQGTNGYELFVQEVLPSEDPVLAIAPAEDGVEISWPGSLENYELLSASTPDAAVWNPVPGAIPSGDRLVATQPAEDGQGWFKLRRAR